MSGAESFGASKGWVDPDHTDTAGHKPIYLTFYRSNFLKQFRQSTGAFHRLTEARGFVRTRESRDLLLECWFLDGSDKVLRGLPRGFAPTSPRQPT